MNADEKLDHLVHTLQDLLVSVENVRSQLSVLIRATDDHESRLRTLERWQHNLTPVLSLGTFIGGALFQIFLDQWL